MRSSNELQMRNSISTYRDQLRTNARQNDFVRVVIAIVLSFVWIYLGVSTPAPWTWYTYIAILFWQAGYPIVFRARHRLQRGDSDDSPKKMVAGTLVELESEYWLSRNLFWLNISPTFLFLLVFCAHVAYLTSRGSMEFLSSIGLVVTILTFPAILISSILRVSVPAVYEPRRQELFALLNQLNEDSTGQTGDQFPQLLRSGKLSPWWAYPSGCCGIAVALVASTIIVTSIAMLM